MGQKGVKFYFKKIKKNLSEYFSIIRKNSFVDIAFYNMMRFECDRLWSIGKTKNVNKINHLCDKWREFRAIERIDSRNVK